MKMKQMMRPALVALAVVADNAARADVFHVSSAQELTGALTVAEANGVADTIYLTNGYYIGNFNFDSTEAFALTVRAAEGVSREAVTIDGDGFGQALAITCSNAANVTVSGITFLRSCGSTTLGALSVATGTNADVLVENCRFLGATNAFGIGVKITACRDATVRNCVAGRDATSGGDGVNISGVTRAVLVERNTVAGNTATAGQGVVVLVGSGVNVTIANNAISNNMVNEYDGSLSAGLYVGGGSAVTLAGNTVSGNIGGGLYVGSGSTVALSGNTISKNSTRPQSTVGGAAISGASTVTLSDNFINENSGANSYCAGGIYIGGGTIVTLTSNTISGNSASMYSGGAKIDGGTVRLSYNTIVGNSSSSVWAGLGGGVFVLAQDATLDGNKVMANTNLLGTGGGLYLDCYTIKVRNNFIAQNREQAGDGAGIWVKPRTRLDLVNNTVTKNYTVANGGGVRIALDGTTEIVNVYNNILFGNTAMGSGDDIYISGTGTRKAFVNNDASGLAGFWDLFVGNLDLAPAFADSANGDYHLSAVSPCVNAGTNTAPELPATDMDGDPRIAGGRVDMGAFEFSNTDCHPADVNANWILETSEFITYSNAWRSGQLWSAASNSIPTDYATRAGFLKESGGVYHNDGSARPLRWKPGP